MPVAGCRPDVASLAQTHNALATSRGAPVEALAEDAAGVTVVPEDEAICCYAKSDKLWTEDPQGTKWETFYSHGEAVSYYGGESACATSGGSCSPDIGAMKEAAAASPESASCCAPNSSCC